MAENKKKRRGPGEGTIYKRKHGGYAAQISIGRDPQTGKIQRCTFYGKTHGEVKKKLNEAKYNLGKNQLVIPSKITVGEWMHEFLEVHKKNSVKQTTYEAYFSWSKNHIKPALGDIHLSKLSTVDIQLLLNDAKKSLSSVSVRHIYRVLNMAIKKAVEQKIIAENVMSGVSKPVKEEFEVNPWSIEEKNLFLNNNQKERLFPLFLVALEGGLRRGELLALRWPDLDLYTYRLSIMRSLNIARGGVKYGEPKAGSKRTITLPKKVILELIKWKDEQDHEKELIGKSYQDQGLIFCTKLGTPIYPRDLNRYFDKLIEKAGVRRIRLHDTRHTHATILLRLGVNPRIVQKRLGHKNIAITLQIYSHFVPELDNEAAAKLDEALDIQDIEKVVTDTMTADVLDSMLELKDVDPNSENGDSNNNSES